MRPFRGNEGFGVPAAVQRDGLSPFWAINDPITCVQVFAAAQRLARQWCRPIAPWPEGRRHADSTLLISVPINKRQSAV